MTWQGVSRRVCHGLRRMERVCVWVCQGGAIQ